MANRRSMTDALTLNPEKLAFIHAGEKAMNDAVEPATAKAPEVPESFQETTRPVPESTRAPLVRRGRKPKMPGPAIEPLPDINDMASFEGYQAIWVPLTTRLSPHTAEALRRAALELKLQRRRPHTQQEIVEAAVLHWLKSNGFLRAA